jgi:hypothetical protein
VNLTLDAGMDAAKVRLTARWRSHKRPELALVTDTAVGLYVADLLGNVGMVDERTGRTFSCSVCGSPHTAARAPRPADGLYCSKPECQAVRRAAKQQSYRLRKGK